MKHFIALISSGSILTVIGVTSTSQYQPALLITATVLIVLGGCLSICEFLEPK